MPNSAPDKRAFILWVIWFGMLSAVVSYQLVLGKGIPAGRNAPLSATPPILYVAIVLLAVASVVRWVLIPRVQAVPMLLVLLLIGLALSESVEFYGLFLIPKNQPQTKLALWILSILSVLQFIPVYANRRARPPGAFQNS